MTERPPIVSVIALCFNHERFVEECLEGIRRQSYPNIQLIVVDDCSSDDSVAVVRDWLRRTETPATFITHAENQGICRSKNEALAHATGDYVSSISTDDVWLPEKLAVQVEQMENMPPTVGVLYGDAYRMDEDGELLPEMFIAHYRRFDAPPDGDIFESLLGGNFIPSMTTLVRRECFHTVGGYDEALAYEDWDMWLRIARRYHFAYSSFVSARYRVLDSSLIHVLLGPRRGDYEASNFRIRMKHLGSSREGDRVLREGITQGAEKLYALDHPLHRAFLRQAGRVDPRRRTTALYVFASLRVPYHLARRLLAFMARVRGVSERG